MTRPQIGARVRITAVAVTDGVTTSVIHEGVVKSAYGEGYPTPGSLTTVVLSENEHVRLGNHGRWQVTVEILEQPLPPAKEPPSGGAAATEFSVWLRSFKGWFDGFGNVEVSEFLTWEQLNAKHPEVRELTYAVPLDAPALPWSLGSCQMTASVEVTGSGFIDILTDSGPYTADEAEQIARAVLAAVRAAREVQS